MSTIGERIMIERKKLGLSQEKLAAELNVSRQAIQKWETNASEPSVENLLSLVDFFHISTDKLLRGVSADEMYTGCREDMPDFEKWHAWESYSKSLNVEYSQSRDEGKDVAKYEALFSAAASMQDSKEKDDIADVIYSIVHNAPQVPDYKYTEPSDYDSIRALSDGYGHALKMPSDDVIADKIYGGWLGRICGCLLGKPVEGIMKAELDTILKRTGNYPLSRYLCREEMTPEVEQGIKFRIAARAYSEDMLRMPPDDDTNYILIGYELVKKYGRDFTSRDVMNTWIDTQPKNAYCTAERVAYRNFVNGYTPPTSGQYKNPFREYIGAQIRGDYFGYINPCDPLTASDMAFRDACISHIKNGIYGEMWVSAMIAAAFGTDSIESVILTGLSYVPRTSRFYEAVTEVVGDYENGMTEAEAFAKIRNRWNEAYGYHWCHTISNACIVAVSLLYGMKDYGKTVCLAVSPGFDTDCNAATAGSVLGVILGGSNIPPQWADRTGDTLCASLIGYQSVSIRDMAHKTLAYLQ